MSKIEEAGRYPAKVTTADLGESGTGTPYIYLSLTTNAGTISAWLYLSEKALPNTIKTLRDAFGFDGNFETVLEQINGKECSITCEFENFEGKDTLKVKWINALRTSAPIADQNAFLKTLTLKAARIPAKAAPGAAPTRAAPAPSRVAPAAPAGNRAVGQAAPPPKAGVDEDVPF